MTDYNMDNEPLDLVKCLYKLHFQLLLLLESFTKLLRLISQSNQDLVTDKSRELALIQAELRKAFKSTSEVEAMEAVPEVIFNFLEKIRVFLVTEISLSISRHFFAKLAEFDFRNNDFSLKIDLL